MERKRKYYPHNAMAVADSRIQLLIEDHGIAGYGIYWAILDVMAQQEKLAITERMLPVICRMYRVKRRTLESVLNDYGLFVKGVDGGYYSRAQLRLTGNHELLAENDQRDGYKRDPRGRKRKTFFSNQSIVVREAVCGVGDDAAHGEASALAEEGETPAEGTEESISHDNNHCSRTNFMMEGGCGVGDDAAPDAGEQDSDETEAVGEAENGADLFPDNLDVISDLFPDNSEIISDFFPKTGENANFKETENEKEIFPPYNPLYKEKDKEKENPPQIAHTRTCAREEAEGEEKGSKEDNDPLKPEKKQKRFKKPTVAEVAAYAAERGWEIDAEMFCNFHESKGWVVGKAPMKNWRAAVGTWVRRPQYTPGVIYANQLRTALNEQTTTEAKRYEEIDWE